MEALADVEEQGSHMFIHLHSLTWTMSVHSTAQYKTPCPHLNASVVSSACTELSQKSSPSLLPTFPLPPLSFRSLIGLYIERMPPLDSE